MVYVLPQKKEGKRWGEGKKSGTCEERKKGRRLKTLQTFVLLFDKGSGRNMENPASPLRRKESVRRVEKAKPVQTRG